MSGDGKIFFATRFILFFVKHFSSIYQKIYSLIFSSPVYEIIRYSSYSKPKFVTSVIGLALWIT